MPMLFQYIIILFEEDKDFSGILERFLTETRVAVYDALVDKVIISSLNQIEGNYLECGDGLYYYLRDGILHTRELCKEYNFKYLVGKKINGKKVYIYPGKEFKRFLLERYGNSV